MNCPVCNSIIPDGSTYCPACNQDLSPYYYQPPMTAQPMRRSGRAMQYQPALQPCPNCGRPLQPGQMCVCQMSTSARQPVVTTGAVPPVQQPLQTQQQARRPAMRPEVREIGLAGMWQRVTENLMLPRRDDGQSDAYEQGMRIVPDCVRPSDDEVPVKQFDICTLRNRVGAFTIAKAKGRLQVTNRRVIFRAVGRGINGRNMLQHEFQTEEVAGMEASSENLFHTVDLVLILLLTALLGMVETTVCMSNYRICGLILGLLIVGVIALMGFTKKLWLLKAFCALGTAGGCFMLGSTGFISRAGMGAFGGIVLIVMALVMLVAGIWSTIKYVLRPELVITIRTKTGDGVVKICRGSTRRGGSGFGEVLPEQDLDKTVREVMAIVRDAQLLDAQAAEKWYQA